jgi:hypothetical protein
MAGKGGRAGSFTLLRMAEGGEDKDEEGTIKVKVKVNVNGKLTETVHPQFIITNSSLLINWLGLLLGIDFEYTSIVIIFCYGCKKD